MPAKRNNKKRGWPERLYERGGYYSWCSPIDGKEYGLGRDKQRAFAQAVEANLHVAGILNQPRLLDRVTGADDLTVDSWCDRYQKILDDRQLEDETRKEFKRRTAKVREGLGKLRIDLVTTKDVADFLLTWESKKRMGQAMRSFLLDLFREAVAAGWISQNPVAVTRAPRVEVTRARLTLEAFLAIHKIALRDHAPWVARSMELALVTAQRREDIALLGPREHVHDGRLWVVQGKTGAYVCIPLDLRLQSVNWSVREVIARCKDNVVARTFIHHSAYAGRAKPGDKLRLHSITAAFAEARDTAKKEGTVSWPDDRTPPSFHEIRSLAARLYTEQGTDAQALLGHKSPDMTAVYRDVRGAEWIEVRT
jgi:Bacteriophage lambda integrase, N-terminal domain./Phage integrase family.